MVDQAELLFSEVLNALCQIAKKGSGTGPLNSGMKTPETMRRIAELEGMLQKEKADFEVRPFFIYFKLSHLNYTSFILSKAVCQCIYIDSLNQWKYMRRG